MKQLFLKSGATLIMIGLLSFNPLKYSGKYITIFQKGKEIEVKNDEEEVQIEKKKFSIRFSNRDYNSSTKESYPTQIAAFLDKSELSKIKVGMTTQEIPCFEPGSGMAPSLNGFYESIIFNNSAHHYLYYSDKKDRRLNLISETSGTLRLEFPINKLFINEKAVKIEKADIEEFYLAILMDNNLNKIIDQGELTKLIVKLK